MNSYFQLSIKNPTGAPGLVLKFSNLSVENIRGGMRLCNKATRQVVVVWDEELQAVTRIGGGATPVTALLVHHLLEQKFSPEN